jgi:hypothetical protein
VYSGIIPIIKQAAVDAVNASQPVHVTFGTVVNVSPLRVQVTPKLTLDKNALTITYRVNSYTLRKGDTLILLRVQGGQNYVVLDKAVNG